MSRDKFEEWFQQQPFYLNLRFIHGDQLFTSENGVYRVLSVQIAWATWMEQQKRIDELKENIAKWQSEVRKAGRDKDMPNDKRKCFMIMANLMDQLVSESLGGDE